jgi:hypothetical protein
MTIILKIIKVRMGHYIHKINNNIKIICSRRIHYKKIQMKE